MLSEATDSFNDFYISYLFQHFPNLFLTIYFLLFLLLFCYDSAADKMLPFILLKKYILTP